MPNTLKSVRVRIAPSPTGNLHVGTARAALFNELFARKKKGQFILRLEDTDTVRSKPEFEENIIESLRWLGISWDEGPDIGGPYGPYRQSERGELYKQALEKLISENKAYYCYCPPKTTDQEALTCKCSQSSPQDNNVKAVIRLKVEPQTITFNDIVRGEVTVHTDTFGGDFTIARSLEAPLYHLAVVADDETMKITHVIRGDDHISNTAKHILIQRTLGYSQPVYAHIPLLLDEQRKKLSKRSGEVSLLAYRDLGYLPEAMLNYLALLGWNPKDAREFFTHDELIVAFSLPDVQKGGAIFSLEKLNSINKHYIRLLNEEELLERALPFLENAGINTKDKDYLKKAIITERERISALNELPDKIRFFLPDWTAEYAPALLIWRKSDKLATVELLKKLIDKLESIETEDFTEEKLQPQLMDWIDNNNLGRGDTLWPMRVALTGEQHSPGPFEVACVLGKEKTLKRLHIGLEKLQ